jgi:hypothetical protein
VNQAFRHLFHVIKRRARGSWLLPTPIGILHFIWRWRPGCWEEGFSGVTVFEREKDGEIVRSILFLSSRVRAVAAVKRVVRREMEDVVIYRGMDGLYGLALI